MLPKITVYSQRASIPLQSFFFAYNLVYFNCF